MTVEPDSLRAPPGKPPTRFDRTSPSMGSSSEPFTAAEDATHAQVASLGEVSHCRFARSQVSCLDRTALDCRPGQDAGGLSVLMRSTASRRRRKPPVTAKPTPNGAAGCQIAEVPPLSPGAEELLAAWEADFAEEDAQRIKDIEKTTNHDVKAVEYWIKEQVDNIEDAALRAELQHIKASPHLDPLG